MRGIFVFLRFPSDSAGYIIHQVGIYRVLISTCVGAYGVSKVSTLNVVSAVQQSTCWHWYAQIIRCFTFRRMPDCYQVVPYTPPEYCNGEQHHQDCDVSRVYSSTFKLIQTQLSLNCFCTLNLGSDAVSSSHLSIRAMEQVIGVYSLESKACSPYIQSLTYTLT